MKQIFKPSGVLLATWEVLPVKRLNPTHFLKDLKNTEGDFPQRFCRYIREKPKQVAELLSKVLSYLKQHPDPEAQHLLKDCLVGALFDPEKMVGNIPKGPYLMLTPQAEAALAIATGPFCLTSQTRGQDEILYSIEKSLNPKLSKVILGTPTPVYKM